MAGEAVVAEGWMTFVATGDFPTRVCSPLPRRGVPGTWPLIGELRTLIRALRATNNEPPGVRGAVLPSPPLSPPPTPYKSERLTAELLLRYGFAIGPGVIGLADMVPARRGSLVLDTGVNGVREEFPTAGDVTRGDPEREPRRRVRRMVMTSCCCELERRGEERSNS